VLINGKWLRTKQSQRWAGEFVWGNTSGWCWSNGKSCRSGTEGIYRVLQ
jgi:hypothetical protein